MGEDKPSVTRVSDVKTEVYKDGLLTKYIDNPAWEVGLYFMEPGMDTIVFSLEESDDGTADEWYGAVYEFYYIVTGEFSVWYGKSAADLREKKGPELVLREGDVASYPPGWKYIVKNTSNIPGAFFWAKTKSPKDAKVREIPQTELIG